MLLDTHCHLDAVEFDADRAQVVQRAQAAGLGGILIPAVSCGNFQAVRELAHRFPGGAYALGIHPLAVPSMGYGDLDDLARAVQAALPDPRFVAIGEIGLDFFVPALREPAMRERQETVYRAQLDLARQHELPVLLHVRRSQDRILKYLRERAGLTGIAHAFNGSFQQAQQFIDLGFVLGIGGAMTFERASQIRRLARELPADVLVLETDAPDIPPAWLGDKDDPSPHARRNEPAEVAGIARELARLRAETIEKTAAACYRNARRVLPRWDV